MTVEQIVSDWLREHGYDGLCNLDCGCTLDDLVPCRCINEECQAAYKTTAFTPEEREEWGDDCDYMMVTEKRADGEGEKMTKDEEARIIAEERYQNDKDELIAARYPAMDHGIESLWPEDDEDEEE